MTNENTIVHVAYSEEGLEFNVSKDMDPLTVIGILELAKEHMLDIIKKGKQQADTLAALASTTKQNNQA